MKKLILLFTIMFAFATIAFANNKQPNKKLEVKEKNLKIIYQYKKLKESCVVMHVYTSSYYDSVTHELISYNTYATYDVDLPCLVNLGLGMIRF